VQEGGFGDFSATLGGKVELWRFRVKSLSTKEGETMVGHPLSFLFFARTSPWVRSLSFFVKSCDVTWTENW
jgi:hypothetical protein